MLRLSRRDCQNNKCVQVTAPCSCTWVMRETLSQFNQWLHSLDKDTLRGTTA
jgi:hypothetical protein